MNLNVGALYALKTKIIRAKTPLDHVHKNDYNDRPPGLKGWSVFYNRTFYFVFFFFTVLTLQQMCCCSLN